MTAPPCAPTVNGASPGGGFPGGGFHNESNTRFTPATGASTPFGATLSIPASTAFPAVWPFTPFEPSVIQPRLLNVYGASLPIRVTLLRVKSAPCVPSAGSTSPGVNGAGLSATLIIAFGFV